MRKLVGIILTLLIIMSLFVGCIKADNTTEIINEPNETIEVEINTQEMFDSYLDRLGRESLEKSPLTATFTIGDLQSNGLFELASQLDHIDLDEIEESLNTAKKELEELESFDLNTLTHNQQLNYELTRFNLIHGINQGVHKYIDNVIQPSSGIQVNIPLALMQIEFESKEEIDAFVLRVQELPRLFDESVAYEQERFELGYGLPGFLYKEVVEQIEAMLVEPEDYMMYLSFVDRIDGFEGLSDGERVSYKAAYLDIIKNEIYPSFEVLKKQAIVMSLSTNSGSVSEWSDGKEYYNSLVKYKTSDELDVEGLRAWANDELESIVAAFQELMTKYPDLMNTDFESVFPSYNSIDEVYEIVNEVYKSEFLDYGVTFASENIIPDYLEEHLAAGFYFPITIDGEDYGNMFLQASDYDEITADTVILYYHENIPGHHLYYSYISKSDQPMLRKMNEYLPYEEGWASYVQNLAFSHLGLEDGVDEFFKLNSAYSNAFMVLMDIKFHYDGISIDEVTNELLSLGYGAESVDGIVNRMISKPGEMIHYMFGEYKMNELKKMYIEKMGQDYDVKLFHDFILYHYGLPFYIVENEMDLLK